MQQQTLTQVQDDGSRGLQWILLVLMLVFSTLLVTSYHSADAAASAKSGATKTVEHLAKAKG